MSIVFYKYKITNFTFIINNNNGTLFSFEYFLMIKNNKIVVGSNKNLKNHISMLYIRGSQTFFDRDLLKIYLTFKDRLS